MQTIDTDALEELVARCHRDGVVLGVHANGDRAIRLLLTAHEKARAADPGPTRHVRHRIEHCTLVDDDILRRTASLGLVAVPFGSYARFHGDKLPGYYGTERLDRMFAHRSLLDAGIAVAGSSDYPCGPLEPLSAIASCVERRALDGTPVGLRQRISVGEALELYTTGAAFATGEEHLKGRLRPGMLADFVELSGDLLETAPADIARLEVRSTWVGGRCVYDAASERTRLAVPPGGAR
jgi:predicted amidohydrolase YtcJ